jgi:Fe2+ transport system protein B
MRWEGDSFESLRAKSGLLLLSSELGYAKTNRSQHRVGQTKAYGRILQQPDISGFSILNAARSFPKLFTVPVIVGYLLFRLLYSSCIQLINYKHEQLEWKYAVQFGLHTFNVSPVQNWYSADEGR